MKKLNFKYLVYFILLGTFIYAGANLLYFRVASQNETIVLEWQTQEENGIKSFDILRKSQSSDFVKIGEVSATGSFSTYKYVDKNIYKADQNSYSYKLRFINLQGLTDGYSAEKSIMPNISSVKRTWGSIKALFR